MGGFAVPSPHFLNLIPEVLADEGLVAALKPVTLAIGNEAQVEAIGQKPSDCVLREGTIALVARCSIASRGEPLRYLFVRLAFDGKLEGSLKAFKVGRMRFRNAVAALGGAEWQ